MWKQAQDIRPGDRIRVHSLSEPVTVSAVEVVEVRLLPANVVLAHELGTDRTAYDAVVWVLPETEE